MLLKSNVVKQLSSIMIHISHSCWRHVMIRPLMSDRLLCMALVFVQSLVDLCSSLWCLSMMNPVHNNCLLTLEMFFKCYCSIASEFLFYRFHKLQWKVDIDSDLERRMEKARRRILRRKAKSQCSQDKDTRRHKNDGDRDDESRRRRPWVGIRNPHAGPSREEYLRLRTAEILQEDQKRREENQRRQNQKAKSILKEPSHSCLTSPCMMLTPSKYDEDFPPLDRRTDESTRTSMKPYVTPSEVSPSGLKPITPAEEVLNWQTHNARAQNKVLKRIDSKIDNLASKQDSTAKQVEGFSVQIQALYEDLKRQIMLLDADLRHPIKTGYIGPEVMKKDKEIRVLQDQVHQIEKDMAKQHQIVFEHAFPFVLGLSYIYAISCSNITLFNIIKQLPCWPCKMTTHFFTDR